MTRGREGGGRVMSKESRGGKRKFTSRCMTYGPLEPVDVVTEVK